MIVADVYDGVKEVTGLCDLTQNLDIIKRGVQLLANKGLFDPLLSYGEVVVGDNYLIALPREVKTVIKLNIEGNPSFRRTRFFEFSQNSPGTILGEEVGQTWSDRLYSPIQDNSKLPSQLLYISTLADAGKKMIITGTDDTGKPAKETILSGVSPVASATTFASVQSVSREETASPVTLCAAGFLSEPIASYYGSDRSPMFRYIKVSKNNVTLRIMFRRDVLKFTSLDDIIPLGSEMAVIHAANAVTLFRKSQYQDGQAALDLALGFLRDEQGSLDDGDTISAASEESSVINASINQRDSIIVGDVYDDAAAIFGPIGREKLFDKITTAIEVLRNKADWDAGVGIVDLWPPDRSDVITYGNSAGTGRYVLPRFVETVLALNFDGHQQIPRNKWFEFHLNTFCPNARAPFCNWDDAGETVISGDIPLDPVNHQVIPSSVIAIPENALDNDVAITIYGKEFKNNQIVDVIRGGVAGWTVPCHISNLNPGANAPLFVSIDKITKPVTKDFVRLYTLNAGVTDVLLGYWYPDEVDPRYKAIKLASSKSKRVTIMYRRRFQRVTSLYDPIPMRSRLALVTMFRAIKLMETDLAGAQQHEAIAVAYLGEARINEAPSDVPVLQFNPGTMPGFTGNIM